MFFFVALKVYKPDELSSELYSPLSLLPSSIEPAVFWSNASLLPSPVNNQSHNKLSLQFSSRMPAEMTAQPLGSKSPQILSSVEVYRFSDDGRDYGNVTDKCQQALGGKYGGPSCVVKLIVDIAVGAGSSPGRFQDHNDLKTAASCLADLLEKAVNLHTIHLGSFGALLSVEPRIAPAILALPSLRSFSISWLSDGTLARRFLSLMHHKLDKLHIQALWTDEKVNVYDVIGSIRNMEIDTLELEDIQGEPPRGHSTTLGFSLPSVRELTFRKCRVSMAMLASAFPSLKVLRVAGLKLPYRDDYWVSLDDADAGSWTSLDHAEGPSWFFEKWSPTFPIRCVLLTDRFACTGRSPMSDPQIVRQNTLRLVKRKCPEVLTFPILVNSAPAPSGSPTPDSLRFDNSNAYLGQADFWQSFFASASRLRVLKLVLYVPRKTKDLMAVLKPYMRLLSDDLGGLRDLVFVRLAVVYDVDPISRLPISMTSEQEDMLASTLLGGKSIRVASLSFSTWQDMAGTKRLVPVRSAAWRRDNRQVVDRLEPSTVEHEEEIYKRIIAPNSNYSTDL